MALRVARRLRARSVGRRRSPQANELSLLARTAPLERTRASRRHATACLLCEHGRRPLQQSADIVAPRSVVTHPLDARARLVLVDEKTPEHPRHAADRLGRGLAACLAWHHDGEPRGGKAPHPAPRRDAGGSPWWSQSMSRRGLAPPPPP